MGRLEDRVAIVTEAGQGIGRATARLFAAEGAAVAVLSCSPDGVATVVAEIEGAGGTAFGVTCDVTDAWEIEGAVLEVVDRFGGVDILVSNAFNPSVPSIGLMDLPVEELRRSFDAGPAAYLRLMQACFPHLAASGDGRVVNFASSAGVAGMMGSGPWAIGIEAVRALTRVAAQEWRTYGITVLGLLPVTGRHEAMITNAALAPAAPSAWTDLPEDDIASLILLLASRDAPPLGG